MSTQLRMSLAQERAQKLQNTRNLRLPLKRMTQPTRRRPAARQQRIEQRKKGMKGQAEAPKTPTNPAAPAAGRRLAQVQLHQFRLQASKMHRRTRGLRRRSRIRSRFSRLNRNMRTFVRSRSRSRFRQLPTTRIIGSKEAIAGRASIIEVFRSYHPEWHDQGWYHSRYQRVELIGGGYYFFNAGYWFPAWGYSPSEQYYAYDGPIYAGHHAEPPDKVIADVQGVLQQMGYYTGR